MGEKENWAGTREIPETVNWIKLSRSGMTVREGAEGTPEGHQTEEAVGAPRGEVARSGIWRGKELAPYPGFTIF